MDKNYEPQNVETARYKLWEERGYFHAEPTPGKPKYSITIPPPNVTGSLHMGHALCYTIQDTLGRWKKMQGYTTLILPGIDHAGIATQNVVEKQIAKEHLTRFDLGREKFVERVWQWKEEYGSRIIFQMKRLGCAFDWRRERFTIDEGYADAVAEAFVRFADAGLIYKGNRMINWCPRCRTVISDIEVEEEEQNGHLWHIRYPFADGSGYVTVATTRPETMLGDTAVAVNPADERYAGLVGKMLTLPLSTRSEGASARLVGREIPLIADDYASLEIGTGAVKVTPAHDPNDYEAGKRNGLPQITVIGFDGTMTADAGERYSGMDRYDARSLVVADLEEIGALEKVEDHRHRVPTCERCHTVIEPLLSDQWFMRMSGTPLVDRAIAAVEEQEPPRPNNGEPEEAFAAFPDASPLLGQEPKSGVCTLADAYKRPGAITGTPDDIIHFVPDRYKKIYLDWMNGLRDWPLSRQLWWGHRIPIYYRPDGTYVAARNREEAVQKAGTDQLEQDPDVLDTWFSSGLWPFATLGWPQRTPDLDYFYPTDVLTTAREILYLWVARMIMTGFEFMGERPFDEVYIYATVLDSRGRRMSKSLGNGVDPVEMIEKYGADALRFSLLRLASKGQDIRFSESRIPEARNFATKLWNAARFVRMNLPENFVPEPIDADTLTLPQRWILSRLQRVARTVNESLGSYDLDDACRALYEFLWNEYCDWFVELSKPSLAGEFAPGTPEAALQNQARTVLWAVLDQTLRLLHPVMPFVTEEIWLALPHDGESISLAWYPKPDIAQEDDDAEAAMGLVIESITALRSLRADFTPGGPENEAARAAMLHRRFTVAVAGSEADRAPLQEQLTALATLARLGTVTFADAPPAEGRWIPVGVRGITLCVPAEELLEGVDPAKESARLAGEIGKLEKELAGVRGKLDNPNFISRAAPEVVEKSQADAASLTERIGKLQARRELLK